jgi:glutamyl-tRNA reductase
MSIVVIGVNHRTAPIELLERVALSGPELGKAISRPGQPSQHP